MSSDIKVIIVPCLSDNYAYILHNSSSGKTAVVDVPEAAPILESLQDNNLSLDSIFITHGHFDHIQGLMELKSKTSATVYGPKEDAANIEGLDHLLTGGEEFEWANTKIEVFDVPGHCDVHIAYNFSAAKLAFVGDALFSLGCGACFTQNYELLQQSIEKIGALPGDTQLFVGHEYTLMCGNRALKLEPNNAALVQRMSDAMVLAHQGKPTLPTTVAQELATNPFLRTNSEELQTNLGVKGLSSLEIFTAVRNFSG